MKVRHEWVGNADGCKPKVCGNGSCQALRGNEGVVQIINQVEFKKTQASGGTGGIL